jgi:hypothetical protein
MIKRILVITLLLAVSLGPLGLMASAQEGEPILIGLQGP